MSLDDAKEYMKDRDFKDEDYGKAATGTDRYDLGLTDLRTRLGYYTIIILILGFIAFFIITGCVSTLLGAILHDETGKEFKNKNKHMVESTTGVALGISILFFFIFLSYWLYNRKKFMREDAALTDIGRIGLEPLSEKEVHNSLTDLVANRVNLSPYQRYQLRQNIGQGFSISNSPYIQRQIKALGYDDLSGYRSTISGLRGTISQKDNVALQLAGQLEESEAAREKQKESEASLLQKIERLQNSRSVDTGETQALLSSRGTNYGGVDE